MQNDGRVQALASSGVPWAAKLVRSGWSSLTPNQKRVARQTVTGAAPIRSPPVLRPQTPRLLNGNPQNQRRTREQPGNAGKSATITRSEFVAEVVSNPGTSGTFHSWIINPREVSTFPQLSAFSAAYNKYRISDFKVRYSPMCSEFTSGRVAIAFSTDSSDDVPATKVDLYASPQCADTASCKSLLLATNGGKQVRYLRDSSVDDPKLVDYGRLVLCTYGQATSDPQVIGELHFEYTVVLSEPNYTHALAQRGGLGATTGPVYAVSSVTESLAQIEFKAGGAYHLAVVIDIPQGSSVVTGTTESKVQTFTDVEACVLVDLKADVPGAKWSVALSGLPAVFRWTVSRI